MVEQEKLEGLSRRDLTELMGKLGALSDSRRFSECAVVRNMSARVYRHQSVEKAELLSEINRNSAFLVRAFNEARDFIARRHLLPEQALLQVDEINLQGSQRPGVATP